MYNASFAQEKVYFYLKTKKYPGFDMAYVCYFGGFCFFLNLSKFCGTGGQREGIALCFVLITASDGLWVTEFWITASECNSKIYI